MTNSISFLTIHTKASFKYIIQHVAMYADFYHHALFWLLCLFSLWTDLSPRFIQIYLFGEVGRMPHNIHNFNEQQAFYFVHWEI